VAFDPYAFAPEVEPAVAEINRRFPALGRGGTYPSHGSDEPGGLEENFYSADFWSTDKDVHDEAFHWIIRNAIRLNIELVISWCRIFSVRRADEGIRRYFQCDIEGTSDSKRHKNHLHVEWNESGYYMPSLADIRAVIREELKANNDNAARANWEADIIPDVWGDPNDSNTKVRALNAVAQIGKDTKSP
jgi:hypothetical protein